MRNLTFKSFLFVLICMMGINANAYDAKIDGICYDLYKTSCAAVVVDGDINNKGTASAVKVTATYKAPGEFETASEAVKNMKIGWNLVNTLDSHSGSSQWIELYSSGKPLDYETAWGNPVTKPEFLKMVRKAGFNTMRIPVTWYPHTDSRGNIDEEWMKRVHEVVDYVIDQGMYCILNTHHDTAIEYDEETGVITFQAKLIADPDNYSENKDWFENVWRQIANEFKDYDQHLVFEGYNEMVDKNDAFYFPSQDLGETHVQETYQAINDYAQSFVNAVRSTGGNNLTRNLVVNTYSACVSPIEEDWGRRQYRELKIPDDIVENHIIFGIHCYWVNDEDDARRIINNVNECFTSRGVPTIISEYGADMNDPNIALTKNAKENGTAPIIWNHDFSDGSYRLRPAFNDTEKVKAALKAYYGDWYEPQLLTKDDYDFSACKLTFTNLWTQFGLYSKELSLNEYKGIRLVMENPNNVLLLINGEGEGKQQQLEVIASSHVSFNFDKSILGSRVSNIKLQNICI